MIAPPLNDQECLVKLTEIAVDGQHRKDLHELAAKFRSPAALAAWIRGLPQRDDVGDPSEGPRVACDVPQRVRVFPTDPNCVERSILYVAAAEIIDPRPVRQLATVETPAGRHTFPVEDGEPVVLEPTMRRNALRAGLWLIRNAMQEGRPMDSRVNPEQLLAWLCDLAEEPAAERDGEKGINRVRQARRALTKLLQGRPVSVEQAADALYTLRAAGEVVPWFGDAGRFGLRVARDAVARLLATQPRAAASSPRNALINPERALYWAGKAVATYAGLGGLYDPAYEQLVKKRKRKDARVPPSPPREGKETEERPAERPALPGSLNALEKKG